MVQDLPHGGAAWRCGAGPAPGRDGRCGDVMSVGSGLAAGWQRVGAQTPPELAAVVSRSDAASLLGPSPLPPLSCACSPDSVTNDALPAHSPDTSQHLSLARHAGQAEQQRPGMIGRRPQPGRASDQLPICRWPRRRLVGSHRPGADPGVARV